MTGMGSDGTKGLGILKEQIGIYNRAGRSVLHSVWNAKGPR